jgi:hypothetical protein
MILLTFELGLMLVILGFYQIDILFEKSSRLMKKLLSLSLFNAAKFESLPLKYLYQNQLKYLIALSKNFVPFFYNVIKSF